MYIFSFWQMHKQNILTMVLVILLKESDSVALCLFFLVDTELKYFGNSCCNGRIHSEGMNK